MKPKGNGDCLCQSQNSSLNELPVDCRSVNNRPTSAIHRSPLSADNQVQENPKARVRFHVVHKLCCYHWCNSDPGQKPLEIRQPQTLQLGPIDFT